MTGKTLAACNTNDFKIAVSLKILKQFLETSWNDFN